MSIGRGWWEDSATFQQLNEHAEYEEFRKLATNLLKNKLVEVFEKIKNNPNHERICPKGNL